MTEKITETASALTEATIPDLDKINTHTLRPLAADEVLAFRVRAIDDRPTRNKRQYTEGFQRRLASQWIGKPVGFEHKSDAREVAARIYDAEVRSSDGLAETILSVYVPRKPLTQDVVDGVETGLLAETSIGLTAGGPLAGKGRTKDGLLILDESDAEHCVPDEVSFVFRPGSRRAGVLKESEEREETVSPTTKALIALGERLHAENVTRAVRLTERKAGGYSREQRQEKTSSLQSLDPIALCEMLTLLEGEKPAEGTPTTSQKSVAVTESQSSVRRPVPAQTAAAQYLETLNTKGRQ